MAFRNNGTRLDVVARDLLPDLAARRLREAVTEARTRVVAEQTARSGGIAPDLADMIVDGRRHADLAAVGHNSRVLLDWSYLAEAVIRTVEWLTEHGPERSGAWKRNVITLIEGDEIGRHDPIPRLATSAVVVVAAPYARRLEVGNAADGSPFVVQVQQHFVEQSCMRLRAAHRSLATFDFNYFDLGGSGRRETGRKRHRGRSTRSAEARANDANVRFPGILIREHQAA